jgi:hypothetical protein
MLATAGGTGPAWSRLGKLAEAGGAYVWAYLVLGAALVVLLRRPQEIVAAEAALRQAA